MDRKKKKSILGVKENAPKWFICCLCRHVHSQRLHKIIMTEVAAAAKGSDKTNDPDMNFPDILQASFVGIYKYILSLEKE